MKGLGYILSYMCCPQMEAAMQELGKACVRRTGMPLRVHLYIPGKSQSSHGEGSILIMRDRGKVLVDAYSKWILAYPLNSSTSTVTIQCLRQSFNQGYQK